SDALTVFEIADPPVVMPSKAHLVFTAEGSTLSASQMIDITNAGGGILHGLAIGTIVYGPGATGWLTASLGAAIAPTSLTVALSSAPPTGTYTATIPILKFGSATPAASIDVQLSVNSSDVDV